MDGSMNGMAHLLRDPDGFFDCVRRGKGTRIIGGWLAGVSVLCLLIFGFVVGLGHSPGQAVSSAIKMPILVIGAGLLCLPALYLFALVLGTRLCLVQTATVVLAGVSVTALMLLGLSPVLLIFVLTSRSYPFFQLLLVGSVALSGCIGLYYLWRGMEQVGLFERASGHLRRTAIGAWFILYAFVGSQMAWRLSPFVGDPDQPFIWLQPSHDNLYVDVIHALENVIGVQVSASFVQSMWIGLMCLVPLVLFIVGVGLASGTEEV